MFSLIDGLYELHPPNVNKAIDFIINEIIKSIEEDDIQFYNSKIKVNDSFDSTNQKNKNRCC